MTSKIDTKTKVKAKIGRPTIFNAALTGLILDRMCAGESLRSICRDPAMPNISTVIDWVSKDTIFAAQYARARELQADALFEDLFALANTPEGEDSAVLINRDRLRSDNMKWVLSKIIPKRFGDKSQVEVSGPDSRPIEVTSIKLVGPES